MIYFRACLHKYHILHPVISDHWQSISLLLQNKAIKRELCLSGHIQLTGGDNNRKWMWLLTDYESYQYSPRLKHNSQQMCHQHALYWHSAHFYQWPSGSVWKHHLFLLSGFVYCTGVVMLVSHSRWRKVLGQGFQKAHCVLFKLGNTHTVWSALHLIEYSVTHAQEQLWSHNRVLLF